MYKTVVICSLFSTLFAENTNSNELFVKLPKSEKKIYWNIPTFQCDYHKLNFTQLAEKYGIVQNENDRFRGGVISILYDPGDFPAILKNDSAIFLRNGGIPQRGNLTLHLEIYKDILEKLVPDEEFSGIGIIDFESWRPIFRQNFGTLTPYKTISIENERKKHFIWINTWIEKEAEKKFESSARIFMENTLSLTKSLRPNATWGYYAYPYCFNMSPNNLRTECPKQVQDENDRISWLFEISDNFYPSIYLPGSGLNAKQKKELVKGRVMESLRIKNLLPNGKKIRILPYFWYKYHGTGGFVAKEDLYNTFSLLSRADIDGVVIWGSSNDVNTKKKCLELYQYIDDVLGPVLMNSFG